MRGHPIAPCCLRRDDKLDYEHPLHIYALDYIININLSRHGVTSTD